MADEGLASISKVIPEAPKKISSNFNLSFNNSFNTSYKNGGKP